MKHLLVALCFPFLTGCAFLDYFRDPVITERVVKVPIEALQSCALLEKTVLNTVDEALIENIELYKNYTICARKQDDSIKLIKKFANIKE